MYSPVFLNRYKLRILYYIGTLSSHNRDVYKRQVYNIVKVIVITIGIVIQYEQPLATLSAVLTLSLIHIQMCIRDRTIPFPYSCVHTQTACYNTERLELPDGCSPYHGRLEWLRSDISGYGRNNSIFGYFSACYNHCNHQP